MPRAPKRSKPSATTPLMGGSTRRHIGPQRKPWKNSNVNMKPHSAPTLSADPKVAPIQQALHKRAASARPSGRSAAEYLGDKKRGRVVGRKAGAGIAVGTALTGVAASKAIKHRRNKKELQNSTVKKSNTGRTVATSLGAGILVGGAAAVYNDRRLGKKLPK